MTLTTEVRDRLNGPRVDRPVDGSDDEHVIDDIKNLRAAVNELRAAVIRIAEEVDRRVPG